MKEEKKTSWFIVEREDQQAFQERQILEAMEQKHPVQRSHRYHALNILEFINTPLKPREIMLSPWLLTQSLNMLYAWRGVGKTYVALGIAFAIATGSSFLRWHASKPRRVLYIDGEMPGASLKTRLEALVKGKDGDFDPANLMILSPDLQDGPMPDLSTLKGQEEICQLTNQADFIVIDNLSTLARSGGRENDAESWRLLEEWALRMRQEGRSVLFIHHSGKGGGQRGTSKKEDILDTVLTLKRPSDYQSRDGARFEVHFEKARELSGPEAEPFEATLMMDSAGRQIWNYQKSTDSNFDQVVALANEGVKAIEISKKIKIDKSNVSRHLRKARDLGLINNN